VVILDQHYYQLSLHGYSCLKQTEINSESALTLLAIIEALSLLLFPSTVGAYNANEFKMLNKTFLVAFTKLF
jgi:hypothetical protein